MNPTLLLKTAVTSSLYTFSNYLAQLCGYPRFAEEPVKEMCDWIENLFLAAAQGQQYGLELVPRECFKTTVSSFLVIYLLVKDPNKRILLSSHKRDHSQAMLLNIKTIVQHPSFIELFGDWKIGSTRWAEDGIIISTRTMSLKEGSIEITGVDSPKTGKHYDAIIIDDIMNESNSSSEAGRLRCLRHLFTMYPILDSSHGVLCLVGTVWHHLDVYMHIIDAEDKRVGSGEAPRWSILRRAAIEDGKLYFPSHLTLDKLEQLKRELPPRWYSVWYFNSPIEEGVTFFPKMHRKVIDVRFVLDKYTLPRVLVKDSEGEQFSYPAYMMLLHDPAVSEDTSANANGIIVAASIPGKKLVVFEAKRAYGPEKTLQFLELYTRKYHPQVYSFEPIASQKLWAKLYRDRMKQAGLVCPRIHEFSGRGVFGQRKKLARIEMLQPLYFEGGLWLRPGLADLNDEMDKFPQGLKDLLDALAQAMELRREPDDEIAIPGANEDQSRGKRVREIGRGFRLPWAGAGSSNYDM